MFLHFISGLMVKAGVVPVLVACASADSLRTKEIISRYNYKQFFYDVNLPSVTV